jgi:hypothetical protein
MQAERPAKKGGQQAEAALKAATRANPAFAVRVARARRSVRVAGAIETKPPDGATLDEVIARIKGHMRKLGPLLDLDSIREPQSAKETLPVTVKGSEGR